MFLSGSFTQALEFNRSEDKSKFDLKIIAYTSEITHTDYNICAICIERILGRYAPFILVPPLWPNSELKFCHYRLQITDTHTRAT